MIQNPGHYKELKTSSTPEVGSTKMHGGGEWQTKNRRIRLKSLKGTARHLKQPTYSLARGPSVSLKCRTKVLPFRANE